MSDPMMPAAGGMPQGNISGKLQGMQSVFNPTDIAAMMQRGEITLQTPFRDVLAKMGISPDDTLIEVVRKTTQQVRKGNPLEKMKALSGAQGGMPQAGMPPGGAQMPPASVGPSAPGSMDELFNR
jgi:hypothetical protein